MSDRSENGHPGARVLALGGCGGVGRYAVETMLRDERVAEIVVGDLDVVRAEAFAGPSGPRVRACRVDVTDAAALAQAMAGVDLVVNTSGPYYRFGLEVLRGVLEAGRDYIDVCDDPEPTLAMLELDGLARERGARAVIGMGITPGVSNLLATMAASELDEVTELVTGWDLAAALPEEIRDEPSAATLHGVEQLTGTIRLLREGRFTDEAPIRTMLLDCPGLGQRRAWTIGHPEPVTLPRSFPGLRECANVFTAPRGSVVALRGLRWLVDRGALSARRAARLAELYEGSGGRTPRLEDIIAGARRRGHMPLPPMFALAKGLRQGRPEAVLTTMSSGPRGGIGGTTGVPLAVGASAMLGGGVAAAGVHAPEAAFDATALLDRLAPLCDPPRRSAEDLVVTVRSWEGTSLLDALGAVVDGARSTV